jgi:hypothetical protein
MTDKNAETGFRQVREGTWPESKALEQAMEAFFLFFFGLNYLK